MKRALDLKYSILESLSRKYWKSKVSWKESSRIKIARSSLQEWESEINKTWLRNRTKVKRT